MTKITETLFITHYDTVTPRLQKTCSSSQSIETNKAIKVHKTKPINSKHIPNRKETKLTYDACHIIPIISPLRRCLPPFLHHPISKIFTTKIPSHNLKKQFHFHQPISKTPSIIQPITHLS